MVTEKGNPTHFISPPLFIVVGSRIRYPGWEKIRIREKHPGSATLFRTKRWSKGLKNLVKLETFPQISVRYCTCTPYSNK
jgi:hypothetical protein